MVFAGSDQSDYCLLRPIAALSVISNLALLYTLSALLTHGIGSQLCCAPTPPVEHEGEPKKKQRSTRGSTTITVIRCIPMILLSAPAVLGRIPNHPRIRPWPLRVRFGLAQCDSLPGCRRRVGSHVRMHVASALAWAYSIALTQDAPEFVSRNDAFPTRGPAGFVIDQPKCTLAPR